MSESASGEADGSTACWAKDSSHTCDECGRELSDASGLKRHIRLKHPDQLDYPCPTCDSAFPTERGLKLHHTRSHDERLGMEESVCENCGDTFEYDPTQRKDPLFCEDTCRDAYQTGENHPNYQGGKVPVECEWCGDVELFNPNKAEDRRFCNGPCYAKWRSHNLTGEDNPYWNGGKVYYYGPNWKRQRRKARKRDQYKCQVCGKDERDLGQIPSTHHKVKIRHFKARYDAPEWYERGNRLGNLVLLCEEHHREWEGMPVQPAEW